jgi:pimeloyl-ACP methyl ester carboxylesterase
MLRFPKAKISFQNAMKKTIVLALFLASIAAGVIYIALSGKTVEARPQEPKLPYPYYSEDVTFRNDEADIVLSGTLTLPEKVGQFPAVVLITGSGPQNRNEEIFGHKPFLVIADYLTRQGFAVMRYDDRGFGKSSGNFMMAISPDFATDAESAVAYLKTRKEILHDKIGLAGHSEGGLVAAIAASRSKGVAFVISLAAPGVTGIDVISLQAELIARAGGVDKAGIAIINRTSREITEILRNTADTTLLRVKLTAYAQTNLKDYPIQMIPPGQSKEEFIKGQIYSMCSPWYQYLYKVEPATFFNKVTCPVLALNGSKDLQVDARQNLPAILKALHDGGNANVTVKELPGLNHLFQKCGSGHPNEYLKIQDTFSPDALQIMSDWIAAQTK